MSSQHSFSIPELELAWKRTKQDRPERCFVVHPHLHSWIETDLNGWLNKIIDKLSSDYIPLDSQICHSPKVGWMVRPGSVVDIVDETVFNALIGYHHDKIFQAVSWSQGDPDIAYQFQKDPRELKWIRADFLVWKEWREKSLLKLSDGVQFVLVADIAGFYENIDLHRLRSDLKSFNFEETKIELTMKFLKRWAQPRGKGIPQGISASDILAKIYMTPVDQALRNVGFSHLRYVDDIRIFCKDILEAKKALLFLSELLRNRGLNLQSSKTKILRIDQAKNEIDGITPVITSINDQLTKDFIQTYSLENDYISLSEIEKIFESNPESPPPQILEKAFSDHFSSPSDGNFDKSLFHYLLNRLGKVKSLVAVSYCLGALEHRPDETIQVLRYLGKFPLTEDQITIILRYMASKEAIYDYQLYHLVKWFFEIEIFPDQLLQLCRNWAYDRNKATWLRTYCVSVVGAAGDISDLEKLEASYNTLTTELEKAEYITAVKRMETGRRNAFYGRVQADGDLVQRAIKVAKSTNGEDKKI